MYAWITHERILPDFTLHIVKVCYTEKVRIGRNIEYVTTIVDHYKGDEKTANEILETLSWINR